PIVRMDFTFRPICETAVFRPPGSRRDFGVPKARRAGGSIPGGPAGTRRRLRMTKAGRAAPRAAVRWIAGPALAALVALSVLPAAASAGNSAASGGGQPTARVWGDVVSWDTNRPVAGATIRLPGYGAAVTSGADGTFTFPRSFPTDAPDRRIR